MADHDEIYGEERRKRLVELLRHIADRIQRADAEGRLLSGVPELMRLLGEARSELFHYEVRSTYDTPELAESRRIVADARRGSASPVDEDRDDDEPWRRKESE
jgi:hypothetical protein